VYRPRRMLARRLTLTSNPDWLRVSSPSDPSALNIYEASFTRGVVSYIFPKQKRDRRCYDRERRRRFYDACCFSTLFMSLFSPECRMRILLYLQKDQLLNIVLQL